MFKKTKHKFHPITLALLAGVVLLFVALTAYTIWFNFIPREPPHLGVTFSTTYSEQLGLDWKDVYLASLDELHVRAYRIPVYWSELEPEPGEYDWVQLDFIVKEAEKRGAKLMLVLGEKVPRWPECYTPDWAELKAPVYAHKALLDTIEEVVLRYKDSDALKAWQIENEYFFPFGVCPEPEPEFIRQEIEFVRSLDPDHPIFTTVSGELEPFTGIGLDVDGIGVSMYRITWNDFFGYFFYPLSPQFYSLKSLMAEPFVDQVIISELQAEPWFNKPIQDHTDQERADAFTVDLFEKNVDFATRTGISEVYLWGLEWWYAQREHNDDSLWNYARELFEADYEHIPQN